MDSVLKIGKENVNYIRTLEENVDENTEIIEENVNENIELIEEEINEIEETEVMKEAKKFEQNFGENVNVFLSSLLGLNSDDIELNEKARTVKKPKIDFVRYFALVICLGIFGYCAMYLVQSLASYAQAAKDNAALRDIFYENDEDLDDIQNLRKVKANSPIIDFLSLQRMTAREIGAVTSEGVKTIDKNNMQIDKIAAMNADAFGWLRVSGTSVDYPVVQGPDNQYYLKHNINQKWQESGAIYMDFANNKDVSRNFNTVFYGHNMGDKSMFGTILTYGKNQEIFNNGVIELSISDGIYRYEVFSARVEEPWFPYFRANWDGYSEDEKFAWLLEMQSRSIFKREGVKLTKESKIITLSTCTNTWPNRRFTVQGVLVEVIK